MLPALIAAGAQIAGGLIGNSAQRRAQEESNRLAETQNERNIALQKEFAQSGIQWKVADAEKAGVHPLFALGAQTQSFTPTSISGGSTAGDYSFIGEAGQNIGRAIDSTRSNPAKTLALEASKIQIDGLRLDNELKRAQLASATALTNQTGTAPGLPGLFTRSAIPGQANGGQTDPTLPPAYHSPETPKYTTNLRAFGKDIQPSPKFSDAQSYENRYGEMSDYIAGPFIAYQDWMHNVAPYLRRHLYDKMRR